MLVSKPAPWLVELAFLETVGFNCLRSSHEPTDDHASASCGVLSKWLHSMIPRRAVGDTELCNSLCAKRRMTRTVANIYIFVTSKVSKSLRKGD
jgi:hypothetical protein